MHLRQAVVEAAERKLEATGGRLLELRAVREAEVSAALGRAGAEAIELQAKLAAVQQKQSVMRQESRRLNELRQANEAGGACPHLSSH